MPCVMPPPWASLRVKIEQQFFKHGLTPPNDILETASFLALSTFLRRRSPAGFMAQSVARHFQDLGSVKVVKLKLTFELPPAGLITVRDRRLTTTTQQFMACLRQASAEP